MALHGLIGREGLLNGGKLKDINRLLQQARAAIGIKGDDLDNYDFRRLSTSELKELAYEYITDIRFNELVGKARKEQ